MKFNILILYEKVLKDFRKTVYFIKSMVYCALGFEVPTVSAGTGWCCRCSIFEDKKVPDPEAASPHLLLCTPSRLTGSAAS